jgi:hypothetical protein
VVVVLLVVVTFGGTFTLESPVVLVLVFALRTPLPLVKDWLLS